MGRLSTSECTYLPTYLLSAECVGFDDIGKCAVLVHIVGHCDPLSHIIDEPLEHRSLSLTLLRASSTKFVVPGGASV